MLDADADLLLYVRNMGGQKHIVVAILQAALRDNTYSRDILSPHHRLRR